MPTQAFYKSLLCSILVLVLASCAILIASWDATDGRFYLDSEGHFRSIPYFQEPSISWEKIYNSIFANPYPAAQRPLPTLSFLLENNLLGLSPKSGRIINVFIHGLNILLLFLLCRRVLIHFGKEEHVANMAALLCALFWGLNPFHADTVFYVIQRMTTLSATFYLLGIIAYLRIREAPGNWCWWGILAISFIGGLASKENAALLPLGLLALEFVLPAKVIGIKTQNSQNDPEVKTLINGFSRCVSTDEAVLAQKKRLFWLLAGVVILPSAGAAALGYNPASILHTLLKDSRAHEFTNTERLLTEGRVLIHYLSLLFYPDPDRLAFVLKYPISQSLFTPISTLISWGSIAGILIVSTLYMRRYPVIWLAIVWFFINHLLESTFIQLEMAFVHRNYLPSIFLFLPIACWFAAQKRPLLTVIIPVTLLMMLFLIGWHSRAVVWGNPIKFWEDSVEKSPGSLRAYINLGVMWDIQKQPLKALEIYQKGANNAYEENPVAWSSLYCNMGIASMHLGQLRPANTYMSKALSLASLPGCLINMAKLQLRLGDPGRAMQAMDRLATIRPHHRKLHLMRARAYLAVNQKEAAHRELQQELAIFPQNREAQALYNHLNTMR